MRKIKLTIDCYISSGCTSEKPLKENVARALSLEGVEAAVNFHRINEEEAVTIGLKGSPSIQINGVDIIPGEISGFS
ncbi:MAG: hypothetical protein JSV11_12490 [Nitrospiraceae bacterium]|nr:MAG: hypothetical protein JSV11_12490 [Nitrospiraceae bacterium]